MSRLVVTYRVRASSRDIAGIAESLALEQSVEVADRVVRDDFVREHVMGRVVGIDGVGADLHEVRIALATATTGNDVAQTFNMLFGNSSLHAHVELADVAMPADFVARFPGPRFGIPGLRGLLGAHGRPLTCAALKPQGLSAAKLAALCRALVLGGVDVVKDDHGLADQRYSPFVPVNLPDRTWPDRRRIRARARCASMSSTGAPG